ncbi:putative RiPP precursor [Mesorhizobium comanense]|nr:putative RiPP precursor [Mesorhizobium comanense]
MTRKTYEKPTLLRREKLSAVVAAVTVSGTSSA